MGGGGGGGGGEGGGKRRAGTTHDYVELWTVLFSMYTVQTPGVYRHHCACVGTPLKFTDAHKTKPGSGRPHSKQTGGLQANTSEQSSADTTRAS